MIGALDDMERLVGAGGTIKEVVAHPLAAGHAARDDLDRLGQIDVGHVISVVGDDLVQAAQGCDAR